MISYTPTKGRSRVRETWADYLAESLPRGEGAIEDHARREVINGLAAVLTNESERTVVREEVLPQMYVRALNAVGGGKVVSDILKSESRLTAARQNLDFLDTCSDTLREMIAMGWLRPIVGPLRTNGQNWMLDMCPVAAGLDPVFELGLFEKVRNTLGVITEIWDDSNGEGVFAFHRISSLVRKIKGGSFKTPRERALVFELRTFAEKYFQLQQRKRNWKDVPQVIVRRIG